MPFLNRSIGWTFGRLAQLVEHLVYTERVGGSSPSPPTTSFASLMLHFAIGGLLSSMDVQRDMPNRTLSKVGFVRFNP